MLQEVCVIFFERWKTPDLRASHDADDDPV